MTQSVYDALCHFPEPTLSFDDVDAMTINKEWEKVYDKKEARRIRRRQGRQERRIKKYGNCANFSISTLEDALVRLCNQQRYDNPYARNFIITTGETGARLFNTAMTQCVTDTYGNSIGDISCHTMNEISTITNRHYEQVRY